MEVRIRFQIVNTIEEEEIKEIRGRAKFLVAIGALAIFLWLGSYAKRQPIAFSVPWMVALVAASLVVLVVCGALLWKRTRFS